MGDTHIYSHAFAIVKEHCIMSSDGNYRKCSGLTLRKWPSSVKKVIVSLLWYVEATLSQTLKLPTLGVAATCIKIPHINLCLHQSAISVGENEANRLRLERLCMTTVGEITILHWLLCISGICTTVALLLKSTHPDITISFTVYLSSIKEWVDS